MRGLLSKRYSKVVLSIAAVFVWSAIPIAGLFMTSAHNSAVPQCKSGNLSATLTGTATAGTTPRGTARYRETGSNRLQVDVRSVNLPAGTNLTVFINDTSVGTIDLPRNGNGQLKVDAPTATVAEGSTIAVRNGTTDVLSGTFACVGGRNSNSNSGNSNMNMNTNMNMNGNSNTNSDTLTSPNTNTSSTPRAF